MGFHDRHYNKANDKGGWRDTYTNGGGGGYGGGGNPFGGRPGPGFLRNLPIAFPPLKSVTAVMLILNIAIFPISGLPFMLRDPASDSIPFVMAISAFTWSDAIANLQIWRFISYQFMHADLGHLLMNMIGLFFFGPMAERYWGTLRFLAFYLICGAGAAFIVAALAPFLGGYLGLGPHTLLIGASGSIFGILFCVAIRYPKLTVQLIIPPIPVKMWMLAMAFMAIAFASVIFNWKNAGGELAHIGGAAIGALLTVFPVLLSFADDGLWRRKFAGKTGLGSGGSTGKGYPSDGFTAGDRPGIGVYSTPKETGASRKLEAEIDRILKKVSEHGLHSLTDKEKKTLQRATEEKRKVL